MGVVVPFGKRVRSKRPDSVPHFDAPSTVTIRQIKESIKTLLACFEEALDEAFDDAQTVETQHD